MYQEPQVKTTTTINLNKMNKLIEILPNVYGVKVPKNGLNYIIKGNCIWNEQFHEIESERFFILPNGNWNILGFLTKDEISFDASEVVPNLSEYDEISSYPFYENREGKNAICFNVEQSFRSALPKEIYFENPFEKPFYSDLRFIYTNYYEKKEYQEKLNIWQTAQENITEKLLILQKL